MPGCTDRPSDRIDAQGSKPVFQRVLCVALMANFAMFVVELVASRMGDSMSLQADRDDAIGNIAVMLTASAVYTSGSRWPDPLVATVIAALNISLAVSVIRLARVELNSSQEECELNPSVPAQFGVA